MLKDAKMQTRDKECGEGPKAVMSYSLTHLRYLGRRWLIVDRTKDCKGRVWVKAKSEGEVLWVLEKELSRVERNRVK